MKLKLDENLGRRSTEVLRSSGHEVATVYEQRLASASDRQVIEACRRERRCLVTLDLEFANPLIFKPSDYFGIAVLRLRPRPSEDDVIELVRTLASGLARSSIESRLWIVQKGRIREYQQPDRD